MVQDSGDKLKILEKDFNSLIGFSLKTWQEVRQLGKNGGVYLVYSDSTVIYVGHTNSFFVRFSDFKYWSTHTLYRKLKGGGKSDKEIKDLIMQKYKYRVIECEDKLYAEALEYFAIWNFKPKYNDLGW